MNPERLGPGFVLPFTHKTWVRNQNFLVSSWIRTLLNPELKVETLYSDTYESEFPCSVNALWIRISWMWWIRKSLLQCKRPLSTHASSPPFLVEILLSGAKIPRLLTPESFDIHSAVQRVLDVELHTRRRGMGSELRSFQLYALARKMTKDQRS